ncbi:hypothetical protein BAUCODRAFT_28866 [Baudoinia panamericana UAMH 10762]|uniref:Uncharacterized protein n=1 Tax=Baudoinia panamericana (strain UAMH 10762) TaxID=717646 RepID=M2M0K3_BAUPA|nr:uncharacterized protein BAUCODRAFT_28866 [Baudoinia panamericana UAMH 10762]EMD00518.1 hypothetical protein BAUCODRAFT_28866 [Baudoinia panamericana UAMH 10762]
MILYNRTGNWSHFRLTVLVVHFLGTPDQDKVVACHNNSVTCNHTMAGTIEGALKSPHPALNASSPASV